MKAIQLIEIGKPLQMREIPVPVVEENDVLIKIKAAGICHTDEHYHAGDAAVAVLPLTLGHEVAGIVEQIGSSVKTVKAGARVGVHYHAICGTCHFCQSGNDQFCPSARMIGKHMNGGYAEYLAMPESSVVPLPDNVPFEHAAIMMCSTVTSFHALSKSRLKPGERVAIYGAGGLGISAIQLARIMGVQEIYAIDIQLNKLCTARKYGAIPINASKENPVNTIMQLTHSNGVDVALEMAGLPVTMKQAIHSLGKMGRAVIVGLCQQPLEINVYTDILGKEAEIIGCSDHLLNEIPVVLNYAYQGQLDFVHVVTNKIPLNADAINDTLRALHEFNSDIRTVIMP